MVVTVLADEVSLSRQDRVHIARRLRLALGAFQPRVVRATLRMQVGAEAGEPRSVVRVSVPLGPAGVVRVEARGRDLASCFDRAIRRIADAIERRLTQERQQLLEFLFLASGAARGRPATSRRAATRRSRSVATSTARESSCDGRASRRRGTRAAA